MPQPHLESIDSRIPLAYFIEMMREAGCWGSKHSPWAARGSKRRLWTEKDLLDAIAYVLYDQGEPLP
jgi:hypothetical protein